MDRPRDDRATTGTRSDGKDTCDPPADDAAGDTARGSQVAMHASRRGFMSLLGVGAVSSAAMSRPALANEGGYGTGEYGTGGYGGTGGAGTPDDDETDEADETDDDAADEGEDEADDDEVDDESDTDDADDADGGDETDDEDSSLSIDTFDLVEVGPVGSDTEFQLSWGVSAPDESLKHVLVVISDLRRLVRWELIPVSGSTAEGIETVRLRNGAERHLTATIAVADAAGNRRTQTID